MKLIIQIPCYNEETTLPQTLNNLPREIPGINQVEIFVIDDGSTDRTVEVAKEYGVNHIVSLINNRGLATAFKIGMDASLELGADIIVNTDADNQYKGEDIPKLIQPILEGKADLVIGVRPIEEIEHFSYIKKKLQRLGSWVVSRFANLNIPDVTSGFRAYSREAALRLNVVSDYTYTLETIIQAGKKDLAITYVPISTNEKLRESRLIKSLPDYIVRCTLTIFRIYLMYKPLKFFITLGMIFFGSGLALGTRFLYFYFTEGGRGHIQSLILTAILMIIGFQIAILGLIGDIVGANRKLLEDLLYKIKRNRK